MDLNRITAFARVVEEGSFTKAAIALGLPKSSVSRNVSLLEEDLGTKLLQRSSRKVVVTEAGAAYYARVGRALATIDEANTAAAEERAIPRGTIRMSAPFDSTNDVFVPLLARFSLAHPEIHIDLSISARHVDLVAEGFDLALRAGVVRDPSLIARKIADVRHGLYVAPSYLARHGMPQTLEDLHHHDCVLFNGQRKRAHWELFDGERLVDVEVTGRISVDDIGAARSAAIGALGIALLAPVMVQEEVAAGELVRVLSPWVGQPVPLSLVYPSARFLPHRVALLRDFLLDELGKIAWACSGEHPPATRQGGATRVTRADSTRPRSRAKNGSGRSDR